MKIVVCIKQVPGTTQVDIDEKTGVLKRDGVESKINPYDLYALETALRLKEMWPGASTVALTMGPPQAEQSLREALMMGIDEVVLVTDRRFGGADVLATSHTLSQAIVALGETGVIVCGQQTTDGDTAQVGPGIAAHLDIPQTCFVRKIESIDSCKAQVQRLMEDGYDTVQMQLPGLISVVKEINNPRLPSLRGKRSARNAELKILTAEDLNLDEAKIGLNGSPTQVLNIFSPKHDKQVEKFDGDPEQAVDLIVKRLDEFTKR